LRADTLFEQHVPRLGVVGREIALPVANIYQVLPEHWRADIAGRLPQHIPEDIRPGDITRSAQADCQHWPRPTRQDDHFFAIKDRHSLAEERLFVTLVPFAVPNLFPRARLVGPDAVRAIEH